MKNAPTFYNEQIDKLNFWIANNKAVIQDDKFKIQMLNRIIRFIKLRDFCITRLNQSI